MVLWAIRTAETWTPGDYVGLLVLLTVTSAAGYWLLRARNGRD